MLHFLYDSTGLTSYCGGPFELLEFSIDAKSARSDHDNHVTKMVTKVFLTFFPVWHYVGRSHGMLCLDGTMSCLSSVLVIFRIRLFLFDKVTRTSCCKMLRIIAVYFRHALQLFFHDYSPPCNKQKNLHATIFSSYFYVYILFLLLVPHRPYA